MEHKLFLLKLQWLKRIYFLHVYGFLLHFTPSNPFIYDFYANSLSENNNRLDNLILWHIYTSAVTLILIVLFTDITRFNILNICNPLCHLIYVGILIWGPYYNNFKVAEIFNGISTALVVAYYSCIYPHINDKKDFQINTAWIRITPLVGRLFSALLGHLFIVNDWLHIKHLFFIDFSALILAALMSIFIPDIPKDEKPPLSFSFNKIMSELQNNLKSAFSNKYTIKWTIWLGLTICPYSQITFGHRLWEINADSSHDYHGAVEGVFSLVALIATVLGGLATFDWKYKGDLILATTSLMQGFFFIFMSQFESVIWTYVFYTSYGFIFHFVCTILTSELAKFLKTGTYGIVFGSFTLFGIVLHSIFLIVFSNFMYVELKDQFLIYGFYYFFVSIAFIVTGLTYWFAKSTYE